VLEVVASLLGPWPVMTLILILGTFALSAEHWWRNRADRVEIVPSRAESIDGEPDDIVDAEVVEHPDMEVGKRGPVRPPPSSPSPRLPPEDGAYAAPE